MLWDRYMDINGTAKGKLKIGVIGTGRIAERFISEAKGVSVAEVAAIYNPRIESAVWFAKQHGLAGLLLTDNEDELWSAIDAIYVASPHETHADYVRKALAAGKHVLCEKPMSFSGEEATSLYELAKSNNLILLEAVKTAYCPGFEGLVSLIKSGAIGKVHDVEACFTKIATTSGREIWGEYGGSFYELGAYPLYAIAKILGTDSIESYIWTLDSAVGTDSYCKNVIAYKDAIATAKTGLGVKSEGELIVAGSMGYIKVPAPWWLTSRIEVHHEDASRVEVYDYEFAGSGLRYEIISFVNRISILNIAVRKNGDAMSTFCGGVAAGAVRFTETVWNELMHAGGVSPEESIWMACQMELFGEYAQAHKCEFEASNKDLIDDIPKPRIWGHRGCSMTFPENTLLAFEKAAQVEGIAGIELDVQLTKDGELVVIHDETVDRTTNGKGRVVDYSIEEIRAIKITPSGKDITEPYVSSDGEQLGIPTLREVFELLKPYCKMNGLLINIELKNSVIRYEGMEQKVINLVREYALGKSIVYSSFNHESIGLVKELDPDAKTGLLGIDIFSCLEDMERYRADALHPGSAGLAINPETVRMLRKNHIPVRMWNTTEPLFGQERALKDTNLKKYCALGVTDIITNVPERYV